MYIRKDFPIRKSRDYINASFPNNLFQMLNQILTNFSIWLPKNILVNFQKKTICYLDLSISSMNSKVIHYRLNVRLGKRQKSTKYHLKK